MILRLGLAQTSQVGDFDRNAATILRFIDDAAAQGVQLLCFPETQTVGYRVDIANIDDPVPVAKLNELHREVARRCGQAKMACVLGTEIPLESDPQGGKPYNAALVVDETGRILGAHKKTRLTPLDAVAYTHGTDIETWDLCGTRVGVVICFEGFRFPESTRACVGAGARLVLHPQSNTTRPNDWKIPVHKAMIVTRACENTIWFASCNSCLIPHQNCPTMIVAPDGRIQAEAPMQQEHLLVADLDLDLATRAMYNYDPAGCAPMLFGDTVAAEEFARAEYPS